ncbi:PorT family protein [Fulvivirga sp. M361]|uniref:porin family protein n=1 Tax=Fulvivirga sp. M361 TaxID=2594266 RepID=UPI001179AA67|nr:porin family protein [Fulvivirga sp. M361]TRX62220.1 PorT family protein [Fulvivirga sp. M361]
MKKTLPLLVILLCISSLAFSQIKFGVKGGFNISTVSFDPDPDLDITPLASFHLGGFFEYTFQESMNLRAELMYSGEGGKLTGETIGQIIDNTEDLDLELKDKYSFLSLPVLFKYNHSSGLTLEAGPTFNFLLAARFTTTRKGEDARESISVDFDESVKGVDLKFAIGAGYELPSGLSFNLRYSASLSSIYTDEYTETNDGLEGTLSLFQISTALPVFAK